MAKKSKAKQNMIKFNELKSAAIPNMPDNETIVKWHGLDLTIKKYLTATEFEACVNGVLADVFDVDPIPGSSENNSVGYMPEFVDYMIELHTVMAYTNVDLSGASSDASRETMYDIIKRTDLIDVIRDNIDLFQYRAIIDGVREKINFYLGVLQKDVEHELEEMADRLEKLVDVLYTLFGDLTPDDLDNLINTLTNANELDKDQLVRIALNSSDKKRS